MIIVMTIIMSFMIMIMGNEYGIGEWNGCCDEEAFLGY